MNNDQKGSIGCFVSTLIVLAFIVIGINFFPYRLIGVLAIAGALILLIIPFYYTYTQNRHHNRLVMVYQLEFDIRECKENLELLVSEIENQDFKNGYDSTDEYLDNLKEMIAGITEGLGHACKLCEEIS